MIEFSGGFCNPPYTNKWTKYLLESIRMNFEFLIFALANSALIAKWNPTQWNDTSGIFIFNASYLILIPFEL